MEIEDKRMGVQTSEGPRPKSQEKDIRIDRMKSLL